MVLEDGTERAGTRMCHLLKSLSDAVIITPQQMSQVSIHRNKCLRLVYTATNVSG